MNLKIYYYNDEKFNKNMLVNYNIILFNSIHVLNNDIKNYHERYRKEYLIPLRNKLDSQITLELYQRIKFKLYKFKTNIKFYQIQLIEPSLTEFLLSV